MIHLALQLMSNHRSNPDTDHPKAMTASYAPPKTSNLATGASATSRIDARASYRNENPATPMKGWVATSYRYYKGQKLGPYFVRRWKTGKKVHKEYVKAEDVERVRAACERHREIRRQMREGTEATNNYLNNFSYLGRMGKHLEKEHKQLRPEHLVYVLRLCKEGCFARGRPSQRSVFVVPLPRRRSISKFKRLFLNAARAAAEAAGFSLELKGSQTTNSTSPGKPPQSSATLPRPEFTPMPSGVKSGKVPPS